MKVVIPEKSNSSLSVSNLQTEITRLTPPHASCATEGTIKNLYQTRYGVIYEKSTCTKTCQQNIWKEKCGCVVPLYEKPENSSVCDCMNHEERKYIYIITSIFALIVTRKQILNS